MKLLLDENLPIKLKYRFIESGFETYTVRDKHWLGTENGELLKLMIADGFTTFVTIDNNLSFQKNFKTYPIQVIVIIAKDNTYQTIMEFFPAIIDKLKEHFTGAQAVIHSDYGSF